MGQPVKYRKPRRINVVSVSIFAVLLVIGVVVYEYLPLYITKLEAGRVLEEYGSTFRGRDRYYTENTVAREALISKMSSQLRQIGVNDPNMAAGIDVEGKEVTLWVEYSKWIEWPFDIVERQEEVYEVEFRLILD